MITATVTVECDVDTPIYGFAHFEIGDSVTDASPFFFPLISAGYATYDGIPPQYKAITVYAIDNPPDGYFLRWEASVHAYVPTDPGFFVGSTLVDLQNKAGAFNIDLSSGGAFKVNLTANAVATFINPPQGGYVASVLLKITSNGHTFDVTGRTGGFAQNAFSLLSTAGTDKYGCESWDNGTTWECAPIMQAIA